VCFPQAEHETPLYGLYSRFAGVLVSETEDCLGKAGLRSAKGREEMMSAIRRSCAAILLIAAAGSLTGCGLVAAPCRLGSTALKILPVVGHMAAKPTDTCANVIDPD
jgi:hypothetical protein